MQYKWFPIFLVTGNRIRICVNIPLAPEDLWKDFGGVDWQPQYDLADKHGIKELIQSKKKMFMELLFWKNARDIFELSEGYGAVMEKKQASSFFWEGCLSCTAYLQHMRMEDFLASCNAYILLPKFPLLYIKDVFDTKRDCLIPGFKM